MAPMIHCVRHAQGYHNLSVANQNMPDPLLTPTGKEQCVVLQKDFPYQKQVDLLVASPIKRTIHTALLGFANVIQEKMLTVIALPELQETSDQPCDTGSSPQEVLREFEGKPVDLSLVKEGWNSKRGKWAASAEAIEKRAREARQWLMARPEKNIVIVTHGGFLHYLTEDWTGSNKFQGTGWSNTEFRSYTFSSAHSEEAHMYETSESKARRYGDEKPLSKEEQTQLKKTASREWERNGYVQAQHVQAKV